MSNFSDNSIRNISVNKLNLFKPSKSIAIPNANSITITSSPCNSPIHNSEKSYKAFDYQIPKYGSLEEQKPEHLYNYQCKCSEASNFPKKPFGSPPDGQYIKDMYLNYIADKQLKNNE